MNHDTEKYLQKVNHCLSGIPEQDKCDILLEIKSHIYEATEKGEVTSHILTRLGSPEKLAKAYSLGYCAENQKIKLSDILSSFVFFGFAGFSGIVIIPALSILTITFIAVAIAIPGTAITNLLGFTHTPMFVWGERSIQTGILQLVLSMAVGGTFALLTYVCWHSLKKYIRAISEKYRKLKLGK